jgi:hypothetical protein
MFLVQVEELAVLADEKLEDFAMRQSVFKQCWECKSPFFFSAAVSSQAIYLFFIYL